MQVRARYADRLVKFQALIEPVLKPFHSFVSPAKVFQLHLFKLPRAESEIAGINLVAKRLADLRNPKGQLLAGDLQNVFELDEDRLGSLRSQVGNGTFVGCGADMRLEH